MHASMLPAAGLAIALSVAAASCSTNGTDRQRAALSVVAAENMWGSIASQVGGSGVEVASIIDQPGIDPHEYEPTAVDARAIATADVVIVNGLGYDDWATKLIDANPASDRIVIDVGKLVGAARGANPHRWYDPAAVHLVASSIEDAFAKRRPADAATFTRQLAAFQTSALADYDQAIASIKSSFSGTAVSATESMFAMLAPALGLELVTPSGLLNAVSEGTDPSAADKATAEAQLSDGTAKLLVFNSQNATPDVDTLVATAKAHQVPVVTITETLDPAGATFQQWQTTQLQALHDALAKATGR